MEQDQFTKTSIADLLKMYSEAASAHGISTAKGDYREGNKQHEIIAAVYRELRRRGLDAQRSLLILLDSPDDAVRNWSASHSLEFAPEAGEPVLESLATNSGIQGFNAKMVLKEWRKGTLSFP